MLGFRCASVGRWNETALRRTLMAKSNCDRRSSRWTTPNGCYVGIMDSLRCRSNQEVSVASRQRWPLALARSAILWGMSGPLPTSASPSAEQLS